MPGTYDEHVVSRSSDLSSTDAFAALDPAVLRQVLQSSAVASALVSVDGSFLWVNPALCELLGRPADRLLLLTWQELTHPDDLAIDEGLAAEVLSGQRESYRLRKRYRHSDGSIVWGDLTVSCVRGRGGEFLFFLAQIVDVTEQVLTSQRYRALSEGAADFLTQAEPDGTLSWVSEGVSVVLGWTPEELTGTSLWDLVDPEDRDAVQDANRSTPTRLAQGQPADMVVARLRTKSGAQRYCCLSAVQVPTDDGTGVRTQGVWRDVDAGWRSRQQLERSRELLSGVLEAELDGHVILAAVRDGRGQIVDMQCLEVNPAACRMLGATRSELIGRSLREISPESVTSGRLARYAQVVETGVAWQMTAEPIATARNPSGGYFDARVTKVGDGVSYAFRDVTDRVVAERRLVESEARLRLVLEHSRDIQLRADEDGVIEYASPAVRDVLGWDPEDLIGHRPTDFLHPEDHHVFTAASGALAEGRSPTRTARVRRKDGSHAWIESVMEPVLDVDGAIVGRIASWRDVSRRVAAEQRLRESEERYRLLAENSSDAVFSATPEGIFNYVSPSVSDLLGWRPEQILGMSPLDLVHPDDRDLLIEHMETVSGGRPVSFRARFRTADGGYRWIGPVVHPIRDEDGNLVGRAGSWRDAEPEMAAERRRQERWQRLQATMDAEIDPWITLVAVRDQSGRITDFRGDHANTAALAALDMTDPQFRDSGLGSWLTADLGEPVVEELARIVTTGEPWRDEALALPSGPIGPAGRVFDVRAAKVGEGVSVTWRDVTERISSSEALAESEQQFRLLAHNSADVVLLCVGGVIRWVSPSLTAQLGWLPDQWEHLPCDEFTHEADRDRQRREWEQVTEGSNRVIRLRMRDRQGEHHWVAVHVGPYLDATGHRSGVIASFRVIDAEVLVEEQRDRLARFDALTGLLNRHEVLRLARGLVTRTPRPGTGLAALYCDIDRFKAVNDEHGHAAGDALLQTVAARITSSLRSEDVVARMGGDEILVLLPGVGSVDQASAVAEKIRVAVQSSADLGDDLWVEPSVSLGVALAGTEETIEQVIARADAALYEAKRSGRNRVCTVD